jgi:hypothetical protein
MRTIDRCGMGPGLGALLGLLLVAGAALPASAALTREFALTRLSDLLEGEQAGVSLTADGALVPAPAMRALLTGEVAYVWSLAPDGRGGVFAGTGSDGRVYHLTGDGVAALVGETLEYELFALTRDGSGTLYFSGAPNGTVMRLRGNEPVETVVDLPQGVVWDLLLSPSGDLYAAGGDTGDIYRITPDGRAESIGRIPDAHVVSLAWWGQRILCGTDGRGLLAAFDPATRTVSVLYDTPQEEIVAILPLGDRILFAANGEENAPAEATESTSGSLPVIEVHTGDDAPQAFLYELRPDGLVRRVWQTAEKHIFSLAEAPDGRVLVGTGDRGLLYALDDRWQATRLADVDESDLLSLAVEGQRVFVGTGNSGAIYVLDWDRRREGSYTSRVLDADMTAQWGTPRWVETGQGRATLETRSGQTREPDETWSDWIGLQDGRVGSPAARFVQWRMQLGADAGADLRISAVSIPYRGPNRPPVIRALDVSPKVPTLTAAGAAGGPLRQDLPGGVRIEYSLSDGEDAPQVSRPGVWARTLRTAFWIADDPDRDHLSYDLHLSFVGEETFYPLKLDLEQAAWTWEAAAWPDGWYRLKVIASDAADNVPGEGLTAEALSAPFQLDNTPPRFIDLRIVTGGEQPQLTGVVEDDASRIVSIEISPDGEGWRMALPADGIFDASREPFAIPVPRLEDGRRPAVIGVRAADEVGNLATARLRISS